MACNHGPEYRNCPECLGGWQPPREPPTHEQERAVYQKQLADLGQKLTDQGAMVAGLRSQLSRARELLGEARRWANLEHHPIRGLDCTPCHEARAQLLAAIDAFLAPPEETKP